MRPLALLLALSLPAAALEISLEENKANRGNIGYIDVQKIYRLFPQTQKAQESFREILRQAEEQVNLRRAELIQLRAEIAQLKLRRDLAVSQVPAAPVEIPAPAQSAPLPAAPAAPLQPPDSTPAANPIDAILEAPTPADALLISTQAAVQASTEASAGSVTEDLARKALGISPAPQAPALPEAQIRAPAAVLPSSAPAAAEVSDTGLAALPGMSKPLTSEIENRKPVNEEPLVINIPGVTGEPIIVQAPAGLPEEPAQPAAAPAAAAPAASTQTATSDFPSVETPAPAAQPAARSADAQAAIARLADIQAELTKKESALVKKESDFAAYQTQVEKNLIEVEAKRSEILLGKIYRAVREVAKESGVSVVVDKGQILFGQDTVDLTMKVVKKLEETPQ